MGPGNSRKGRQVDLPLCSYTGVGDDSPIKPQDGLWDSAKDEP